MFRNLVCCMFVMLTVGVQSSHAVYSTFRWGISSLATNSSGSGLLAGQTVLSFCAGPDAGVDWDGTWTDTSDGGNYGAIGDDFYMSARPNLGVPAGTAGFYNTAYVTNYAPNSGVGYYVYAVVIDVPYTTFVLSGITDGSEYGVSALSSGVLLDRDTGTPPAAQTFNGGTVLTTSQITIVPEPTTLALFATGVGVLMMRRRKKQAGETEQSA